MQHSATSYATGSPSHLVGEFAAVGGVGGPADDATGTSGWPGSAQLAAGRG